MKGKKLTVYKYTQKVEKFTRRYNFLETTVHHLIIYTNKKPRGRTEEKQGQETILQVYKITPCSKGPTKHHLFPLPGIIH